jgi:hypothetical protein
MLLQEGSRGPEVAEMQGILLAHGFGVGRMVVNGVLDDPTMDALLYFQQTHLNSEGRFLEPDGKVLVGGTETWWALYNASGDAQRNYFDPFIPEGVSGMARAILEVALAEHAKGVREEPDGSNWGPEISKYGGQPGWPWCCLFTSWCEMIAYGAYPLGAKYALCAAAWKRAKEMGRTFTAVRGQLRPGQQFMILRGDGTGHTGFIAAVSADETVVNTVEGNCGNRVKVGQRPVSQFAGVIDFFDLPLNSMWFERGLFSAKPVGQDGTR